MTWYLLLFCILGYYLVKGSAPWSTSHHDWRRTNQASPNTSLPGSSLCPSDLVKFIVEPPGTGPYAARKTEIIITSDFVIVAAEITYGWPNGPYRSYFLNLTDPHDRLGDTAHYFVSTNSHGSWLFGKVGVHEVERGIYWFTKLACFNPWANQEVWNVTSSNDAYFMSFVYDPKKELIYLSVVKVRNNAVWTVDALTGTVLSRSRWLKIPDNNGASTPTFLLDPVTGYLIFPTTTKTWYAYNPINWTEPIWTLTSPLLTGLPSPLAVITEDGILVDARFGLNMSSGTILWENTASAQPLGLIRPVDPPINTTSPTDLYLGFLCDSDGVHKRMVAMDTRTGVPLSTSDKFPSTLITAVIVGPNVIYAIDSGIWMVDIKGWGNIAHHKQLANTQDTALELAISPQGTLFGVTNGFSVGYEPIWFSVYEDQAGGSCALPPLAPDPPPIPLPPEVPVSPPQTPNVPAIVIGTLVPVVVLIVALTIGLVVYKRNSQTPLLKAGYEVVN